jgi:hypothetical protein
MLFQSICPAKCEKKKSAFVIPTRERSEPGGICFWLLSVRSERPIRPNIDWTTGVLSYIDIAESGPEAAMRLGHFALCIAIFLAPSSEAQTEPPAKPPQTARQALIEMFFGKGPDSFIKHLPKAAKQVVMGKDETQANPIVLGISTIGRQLSMEGHVETFDEGPNLLVSEKDEGKQKIKTEVTVEHDGFAGDTDEIELSIHIYRDGQPEFIPVIPRLTLTMTQENEIWKLTNVDFSASVPLTDPDYLKGVRKEINESNETMAQMRVGIIMRGEATYKAQHPNRGYTCNLSDLFPKPATTADAPPAYASPGITEVGTGSESPGYHFQIAGCDTTPATKFQITATPLDTDAGMKAFCADESGTLRFDASGSGSNCLSQGQPVNSEVTAPASD